MSGDRDYLDNFMVLSLNILWLNNDTLFSKSLDTKTDVGW